MKLNTNVSAHLVQYRFKIRECSPEGIGRLWRKGFVKQMSFNSRHLRLHISFDRYVLLIPHPLLYCAEFTTLFKVIRGHMAVIYKQLRTHFRIIGASRKLYIVWCVIPFLPFLLPKLILLAFWLSWGSNKTEILGFNFSRPSTPFYVTIFKMAVSKLNMPHIDPSKLHTITNFVSEPMFLIMKMSWYMLE